MTAIERTFLPKRQNVVSSHSVHIHASLAEKKSKQALFFSSLICIFTFCAHTFFARGKKIKASFIF